MSIAGDHKLQELNRLIRIERDPQKLELADDFNLRMNENARGRATNTLGFFGIK